MNPPPRQPSYGPGRPPPPGQYGRPPSSMPAPTRSSTMNSMGRPLPPNPQRQGSQYGAPMPPQHRSSMHHPMPQRPPPPQATSSSSSSSSHYAPIGTDQRRQSREYLYQTRASRPPPPPQGMYQRPPPPQHHPSQRNGPPPPAAPPGTAYRRANTVSRSKSLSRPERQRPRQGMFRTPSQQRRMIGSGQLGPIGNTMMHHYQRPPPRMNSPNQPMSNRLQQQLHQQKLQQQQEALNYAAAAPNANHRQLAGPAVKGKYNPQPATPAKVPEIKPKVLTNWWSWMAFMFTCCCPNWCLRVCLRKRNPWVQQAWREKVTLCVLILLLCAALGYVTYGLTRTLCPTQQTNLAYSQELNGKRSPVWRSDVRVYGSVYDFGDMVNFMGSQGLNFTKDYENLDISSIFDDDTTGACTSFDSGATSTLGNCVLNSPYGGSLKTSDGKCISTSKLNGLSSKGYLAFDWEDLRPKGTDSLGDTNLVLVGDSVLNLTRYVNTDIQFFGAQVDKVLQAGRGNDISYSLLASSAGANARQCLVDRYSIGIMEVDTAGCIASQIIMTTMLVVIVAMIIIRYSMALMFQWIIASRLVKPGGRSNWLAWRSIKGGNDDPANHVPGPYNNYAQLDHLRASSSSIASSRATPTSEAGLSTAAVLPNNIVSTELYTAMMVTCYSEGEEGIRTTMDSLALTTYNKKRKAFFVICDGMITGAGESRSTPDIVVSMMDLDPTMRDPKPSSYLAIADGEKQLNMAKVYAGHYKNVPCITIVKCGTEEEGNGPKAGNRGKRDSQLILMSFFQRVLFNDRFSELDYEIFWKLTWLMKGTTPDKFELVLMVDADTKVLPDAITYMVAAMANDITIMGLCGETRIANKSSSWVTAIQVFEYYISHHYAKAFESLFGIVTCLPGCFCMYRIKAPKNGAWVPILANPDIILEYNQNVVATLHEKNLLLLGEDRFLSTLMLRTFPKRQMMFVPQARCKTVVPDEFRVLLSQRRRWINSTVHNLMELVLVSDLCGIACLSMQFSIFVDLLGTLVLPAAICMTVYLIINTAISANPNWQSLALLIAILGLPAVLIAITSFNYVYIMWMFIYIISLPIWNLVLPVYSFWHFDDFSWGATRVVAGEKKDKGHGDGDGKFDSSRLVMKKWEDWEAERTGQRVNKNRMSLRTPGDPPLAFDGYNPAQRKSGVITPTTPGAFGGMFNDRKMYGSPSNQP